MKHKQEDNSNLSGQKIVPKVLAQPLVEEMKSSYLDYAMSVIVARALPDVRDGLKPVHRKILFSMGNLGLRANAKFKKSATVVGDVLGKYHPHGDVAIYDSLVRMAQDFAMRYPLVNGQGNFGSIDGDSAAAMRYTEAKLMSISDELLSDLDKETVDFVPNYDGSRTEPTVLPAKLPNLLLNGSVGIAVGMATNIPPHNLTEVCNAAIHLINNPGATVDDLMEHVKGPDFPTAGTIYNVNDIKAAYATGKGSIVMRGTAEIEIGKTGQQIIISDLPYQVNKASLLEKIAELVKDKKIEGIRDLRDESNRHGIRVVVELKRDAYPKKILNALYKYTQLQEKFHVNTLALIDGLQPKVLTLKTVLEEFVKHRQAVIKRRAEFELNKAKERAHILEGLVMALEDIDKIIETIKKSKDKDDAKINLIKRFKLSDRQAVAILEMRLQQLANLERIKVEEELKEKRKLIKELETLLASSKKILQVVEKELTELRDKYGDERRTKIVKGALGSFSTEDLIPNEAALVMLTHDGYIKRLPPDTFKVQTRGGKGVAGVTTKEEDLVEHLFATNTHADLWFFTSRGRLFQLKAYDVPPASRTAKGQAIVNFLQLAPEEKIAAVLTAEDLSAYKYLIMVSRQGTIKKTEISAFANVRRSGLIVVKLKGEDVLQWVKPATGKDDVMLITAQGQSIRFKEKDVRPMGRAAAGVRGVRLSKKGDEVVGMDLVNEGRVGSNEQLLVIMDNGYGKRTPLGQYKVQGRGGSGIKTAMVTPKTGKVCFAFIVNSKREQEDVIVISEKGQLIRMALKSVSVIGRATQGVRVMKFKQEGDRVASVTFI
jgi:DNA gyrase subunit A